MEKIVVEATLIILKPDCCEVTQKFQQVIQRLKSELGEPHATAGPLVANMNDMRIHYQEVIERVGEQIGTEIVANMCRGPCYFMIYHGPPGLVSKVRNLVGATDPLQADPGTIRATFGTSKRHNIIHASDSVESGKREIEHWSSKISFKQ